jgi:hypothetical protein
VVGLVLEDEMARKVRAPLVLALVGVVEREKCV